MLSLAAVVAALATLAALVALPGCSSANRQVRITDAGFSPAQVSIKVGDTVTWTNEGGTAHTVTWGTSNDSGAVYPGSTYSYKFDVAGTYNYSCRFHTDRKGTVTVR